MAIPLFGWHASFGACESPVEMLVCTSNTQLTMVLTLVDTVTESNAETSSPCDAGRLEFDAGRRGLGAGRREFDACTLFLWASMFEANLDWIELSGADG